MMEGGDRGWVQVISAQRVVLVSAIGKRELWKRVKREKKI